MHTFTYSGPKRVFFPPILKEGGATMSGYVNFWTRRKQWDKELFPKSESKPEYKVQARVLIYALVFPSNQN